MAKTDPLDPNVPANTESPRLGAQRIRELAKAVAELLNVDHYMGTEGGAGTGYNEDAAGEHKQVKFNAPISTPTNEADKMVVYGKDVGGKIELHCLDEDGNEIQITSAGILNSVNLTGDQTITGNKTFASILASQNLDIGDYELRAQTLEADVATGTAPLTIASTTKVTNLNADKVDGYDISAYSGSQSYTFPGGLVLKHGITSVANSATISFSSAFPNSCISVQVANNASGTWGAWSYVTSISVSGFNFNWGGIKTGNICWLALGW